MKEGKKMNEEDDVTVIKIGYDKVEDLQKVFGCVEEFMKEMGKMNAPNETEDLKKILKNCEDKLKKYNDAKNPFANEPATLKVLDEGTKLLIKFNKNFAEILQITEEFEKKHGKDAILELTPENCPALNRIENCCKDIMNWAQDLQATYRRTGIKIDKEF